MDQIFELFVKNKDHINYMVRKDATKGYKFSDVYHMLFPSLPFTAAMESFLGALNTLNTFEFNEEIDGVKEAKEKADEIYSNLGIPWPNRIGAHDFLVYLIWVYPKVIKAYGHYGPRKRFDNIFGFMDGFVIQSTRVVIIGQDPSPTCQSTGYAFHGSKCLSTKRIIDFLNMEFRLADVYNNAQDKLELFETDSYKSSCKLDGWIDQNVLMFNTYLTLSHLPKSNREAMWLKFTMFLVHVLSKTHTNLVFILTGGKAEQMSSLITEVNSKETRKHVVFCVLHPNYKKAIWDRRNSLHLAKWETKHWDVDLPFINTNFYLYQLDKKEVNIIDWHTMSKSTAQNQFIAHLRLNAWRVLFEKLIALTILVPKDSTVCTEPFLISGVRKVLQLKRNTRTGFYQVRCIDAITQRQ